MNVLDSVLSLVAPHHCLKCGKEGFVCCQRCLVGMGDDPSNKVCYSCSNRQRLSMGICTKCKGKQALDGVFWYSDYKDEYCKKLIESLKFNNNYEASRVLADAIGSVYLSNLKFIPNLEDALVTHIPTANKRVRQRGWDQAKLISKQFARAQNIPHHSLLLRTSSFDQIGATKAERQDASSKFFAIRKANFVSGKQIIIIDDVLTTGSSFNAAAKVLKEGGAKRVYAISFSRQGLTKA